jgi:hypothetical protein
MQQDSIEWIDDWSIEKYNPITENWHSDSHGTDQEPAQSLLLSAFSSARDFEAFSGMSGRGSPP